MRVKRMPFFGRRELADDMASLASKPPRVVQRTAELQVQQLHSSAPRDGSALLEVAQCRSRRLAQELCLVPNLPQPAKERALGILHRLALLEASEGCADLAKLSSGDALTPALLTRSGAATASTALKFVEALLRHPKLHRPPTQSAGAGNEKDDRHIQLVRDLERDVVCIDGATLQGSAGFASVLGHLVSRLRSHSASVKWWGPVPVGDDLLAAFAKLVLRAANRTESGGLSFEAIAAIISANAAAKDELVVVPDSTAAEPLRVDTSAGAFREPLPEALGVGQWHALGLRVHLEAVTAYNVYSHANMEDGPLLRVRARYRNRVYLPLLPPREGGAAACASFADIGYSSEAGLVELTLEPGEGLAAARAAAEGAAEASGADAPGAVSGVSAVPNVPLAERRASRVGALFDRLDE